MQPSRLEEKKVSIVGAGITGAMEALYTYLNAQSQKEKVRITVYERYEHLSSTTIANIAPGLTAGEIMAITPETFKAKLEHLFSESGGIRVDDVPGVNSETSEYFKSEVQSYSSNIEKNSVRTQVLWALGQKSMESWQNIYDAGDPELRRILEDSNFNPCREPNSQEKILHDGYKINLVYNTPNAENLVNSRTEFYKSLGYVHSTILSAQEVIKLDSSLAGFCKANSESNGPWKSDAVAVWRPGGCIDPIFLPKLYDYLRDKMGKDDNSKDRFKLKLNKEVVEVGLYGNLIQYLKFASGKITSQKHRYLSSTYVFCPGEAVGTLKKLGFEEPASIGIAGASLRLDIPLTFDQQLEFSDFNNAITILCASIGLSCQARLKEGKLFIGVAGGQAFYGDQKPSKDQDFCKTINLLQLNVINDVWPQFVSLALGIDTRGCKMTREHLTELEEKDIAKRWVGTRAVAYDGFPTLGILYKDDTPIQNARTTTSLGSGGVSFSPICVQISQASLQKVTNDQFVDKVLGLTSSKRSATGYTAYTL
jgi:hypothetical protein